MNNCIERMQDNLCTLRRSLGWSAADLAKRLGLTRQYIAQWENKSAKMKLLHYLAISKVVEDEINKEIDFTGNDKMLCMTQILMDFIIKDDEWFDSEEEKNNVETLISIYSEAVFARKKSRSEVHNEFWNAMEKIGCGNFI